MQGEGPIEGRKKVSGFSEPPSLALFLSREGVARMADRKSVLRAVMPDEAPAPKILTLSEAVALGDYLEILRAQRREMVDALPETKGPALAAMHRQLALISKEIASMESKDADEAEGGANVDDEEFDAEAV